MRNLGMVAIARSIGDVFSAILLGATIAIIWGSVLAIPLYLLWNR